MALDRTNHPCFNDSIRHKFGRVHIPVASRCNIQCRYCNRKFDCVNESRPGVTSAVLTPEQALFYLRKVTARNPSLKVVGIAGPGDPFANPEETMESLRLVRKNFPEMLLCVATNGLNVEEYADELKSLDVSHVTITMNAVDPEIAAKIYSWVRYDKKVYGSKEGAEILVKRQLSAIKAMADRGLTVKINSVVIPGINDHHIPEVAKKAAELGASISNCIPMYKTEGTDFENIDPPDSAMIHSIKAEVGKYIPMMHHCKRCRADAIGLIGENLKEENISDLQEAMAYRGKENAEPASDLKNGKKYIAVATLEGVLVNAHLGESDELVVYEKSRDGIKIVERRKTPLPGGGDSRWEALADKMSDCFAILAGGSGDKPKKVLAEHGISLLNVEGMIEEIVPAMFDGKDIKQMVKKDFSCASGCSGTGGGCG